MSIQLKDVMTHSELVIVAYKWVLRNRWGVAFREFRTAVSNGEFPDVIGFCSGPSVVVECKTSRADFFADKTKHFRVTPELGMGDWRYYCCPEGLIKREELPEGWGLIEVLPTGKTKTYKPILKEPGQLPCQHRHYEFKKNILAEHGLMYSALRRLQIRNRIEEVYTDAKTISPS